MNTGSKYEPYRNHAAIFRPKQCLSQLESSRVFEYFYAQYVRWFFSDRKYFHKYKITFDLEQPNRCCLYEIRVRCHDKRHFSGESYVIRNTHEFSEMRQGVTNIAVLYIDTAYNVIHTAPTQVSIYNSFISNNTNLITSSIIFAYWSQFSVYNTVYSKNYGTIKLNNTVPNFYNCGLKFQTNRLWWQVTGRFIDNNYADGIMYIVQPLNPVSRMIPELTTDIGTIDNWWVFDGVITNQSLPKFHSLIRYKCIRIKRRERTIRVHHDFYQQFSIRLQFRTIIIVQRKFCSCLKLWIFGISTWYTI